MPQRKPKVVIYRRKREGKTNYRKRLHLLLAKKPRLVIRLTNQKIIVQLAGFHTSGDLVLAGVDSSILKKYGWNFSFKNFPAAYLTGYLAGRKALQKKIKEAVLDLGFKLPLKSSKIYACLKGALDAGLDIPHSKEILPPEDKISGKHIQEYASKIKGDSQGNSQRIFSKYLKNSLDPAKIVETFQKVKQKIKEENA